MEFQDTASSIDRKFTFSDTEIQAVQAGLSLGLYNSEEDRPTRQAKWRTLFDNLCNAFGMVGYHLEFTGDSDKGAGAYDRGNKTVYIGSRFSLTTLLHHFLVALVDSKRDDAEFMAAITGSGTLQGEELIAAFSLSLFREAAPEMYEKAKSEGKLIYFVQKAKEERRQEQRRRQQEEGRRIEEDSDNTCGDCGCEDCECEIEPEPMPGAIIPDIDPENRVDRGNGFGED